MGEKRYLAEQKSDLVTKLEEGQRILGPRGQGADRADETSSRQFLDQIAGGFVIRLLNCRSGDALGSWRHPEVRSKLFDDALKLGDDFLAGRGLLCPGNQFGWRHL